MTNELKKEVIKAVLLIAVIIIVIQFSSAAMTYINAPAGIGILSPAGTCDVNSSSGGICIDSDCQANWSVLIGSIVCTNQSPAACAGDEFEVKNKICCKYT